MVVPLFVLRRQIARLPPFQRLLDPPDAGGRRRGCEDQSAEAEKLRPRDRQRGLEDGGDSRVGDRHADAAGRYLSPAQKRWMRVQASSSASVEVA